MPRHSRKLTADQANERSKVKAKIDREADTIYWIEFIPSDGKQTPRLTTRHPPDDDLWRILIGANPDRRPDLLERAIRVFEERRHVTSWKVVAGDYLIRDDYFP